VPTTQPSTPTAGATPNRSLIERYDLPHPAVPPALDGFTILHLTDLHVRRRRPWTPTLEAALRDVASVEVDLVVLSGDYTQLRPDRAAAVAALQRLAAAWRSRLGAVGVMGNHDWPELTPLLRAVPGVRWLDHDALALSPARDGSAPPAPLVVLGAGYPEDLFALALTLDERGQWPVSRDASSRATPPPLSPSAPLPSPLVIACTHYPSEVYAASELGVHIVLAGHTHGGQIRLSPRLAPHTSTDLPPHLACGVLRLDNTLLAVSRGLGNSGIDLRLNCPPQIPLYTLRRAPLPGGAAPARTLVQIQAW
jgi:predicted MPP superfamily phosphohydrolase